MAGALARGGFSLLELLVVLALIALIGALALPNLTGLYGSAARAVEREQILDQFAAIGPDALLNGRGYVVYGTAAAQNASMDAAFAPYPLSLPDGWLLELDRPLRVRSTGVCLGATLTLRHPDTAPIDIELVPPYCRVATDV